MFQIRTEFKKKMMAADVTGPESLTAKRITQRKLVQDHTLLWEQLEKDFGYRLNPTPKKDKHSPSKFVLEVIRGKGKRKKRLQSCTFKLKFTSKSEVKKIENTTGTLYVVRRYLANSVVNVPQEASRHI